MRSPNSNAVRDFFFYNTLLSNINETLKWWFLVLSVYADTSWEAHAWELWITGHRGWLLYSDSCKHTFIHLAFYMYMFQNLLDSREEKFQYFSQRCWFHFAIIMFCIIRLMHILTSGRATIVILVLLNQPEICIVC